MIQALSGLLGLSNSHFPKGSMRQGFIGRVVQQLGNRTQNLNETETIIGASRVRIQSLRSSLSTEVINQQLGLQREVCRIQSQMLQLKDEIVSEDWEGLEKNFRRTLASLQQVIDMLEERKSALTVSQSCSGVSEELEFINRRLQALQEMIRSNEKSKIPRESVGILLMELVEKIFLEQFRCQREIRAIHKEHRKLAQTICDMQLCVSRTISENLDSYDNELEVFISSTDPKPVRNIVSLETSSIRELEVFERTIEGMLTVAQETTLHKIEVANLHIRGIQFIDGLWEVILELSDLSEILSSQRERYVLVLQVLIEKVSKNQFEMLRKTTLFEGERQALVETATARQTEVAKKFHEHKKQIVDLLPVNDQTIAVTRQELIRRSSMRRIHALERISRPMLEMTQGNDLWGAGRLADETRISEQQAIQRRVFEQYGNIARNLIETNKMSSEGKQGLQATVMISLGKNLNQQSEFQKIVLESERQKLIEKTITNLIGICEIFPDLHQEHMNALIRAASKDIQEIYTMRIGNIKEAYAQTLESLFGLFGSQIELMKTNFVDSSFLSSSLNISQSLLKSYNDLARRLASENDWLGHEIGIASGPLPSGPGLSPPPIADGLVAIPSSSSDREGLFLDSPITIPSISSISSPDQISEAGKLLQKGSISESGYLTGMILQQIGGISQGMFEAKKISIKAQACVQAMAIELAKQALRNQYEMQKNVLDVAHQHHGVLKQIESSMSHVGKLFGTIDQNHMKALIQVVGMIENQENRLMTVKNLQESYSITKDLLDQMAKALWEEGCAMARDNSFFTSCSSQSSQIVSEITDLALQLAEKDEAQLQNLASETMQSLRHLDNGEAVASSSGPSAE